MTVFTDYKVECRRDSAADWNSNDPVLPLGQIGVETDTVPFVFKIGDGSTAWTALEYSTAVIKSLAGQDITITPGTTGNIILDGSKWPQGTGTNTYLLQTDGTGQTSWVAASAISLLAFTALNNTGGTLTKGTPVYISATGPEIAKADADGSGTMDAVGIVSGDITTGNSGSVMVIGELTGINTSAFAVNDTIYVSVTAGGLSAIPTAGTAQELGICTVSNAVTGEMIVNVKTSGLVIVDGSSFKDANDNEIIKLKVVSSAVVEVEIGNNSTGNAPTVTATGGDTNIDLLLAAKGTGLVKGPAIPFPFALSDNDTALTTGIKWTWYASFAGEIEAVHAGVKTAPTTSGIIVDIHKGGATIMTTDKLDIDVTENDTVTAATPAVLTTTTFAAGDKFEFEIDQIGSGTAGAGLTVTMLVRLT